MIILQSDLKVFITRLLTKHTEGLALCVLFSDSYRAVAHAARGAQCRDDGGDDAAYDLEDGLPSLFVLCSSV